MTYTLFPETTDQVVDYLNRFLQQLKSYYHPSNSGQWSGFLVSFVSAICAELCKRVKRGMSLPFLIPSALLFQR